MKHFMAALLATIAVATGATPLRANDAQIAQQIIGQLRGQQEAANLQGFNIGVQVEQGTVTMLGDVASREQATLALEIARRVPGVQLVVNDLEVRNVPAPLPQQVVPANLTYASYGNAQLANAQIGNGLAQPVQQPAQQPVLRQPASTALRPAYQKVANNRPVALRAAAPRSGAPRPYAAAASYNSPAAASLAGGESIVEGGPIGEGYAGDSYVGGEVVDGGSYYGGDPVPMQSSSLGAGAGGYGGVYGGGSGLAYDNAQMPGYAWPSYAAYPNYGAVSYPTQYSATAWPYIGPFYPYPQVPLGWRKVMLEWDDGWWWLDFKAK
ncbi:MAG: BON domain-containing protein [Pirellulales bacterium]